MPDLAECEPAYECVMKLPGDDQWIEFEELNPGGTVCGARRQGTGAYGFGSAGQALTAASGLAADDRWVAAVCAALARERTWRRGRRPSLLVKEGSGEMFHVTATENRQSILRHGLDWRQMGTTAGIAGSRESWTAGRLLVREPRATDRILTEMSRLPADVWAVRVDGLWVESGPDGWIIVSEPVPPERLRLLQG